MLIINADDFGRDICATDRALFCYKEKRLTSTTGMVFMEDSERAAQLAREVDIAVGLHINFSQQFTAGSVPAALVTAHRRVSKFLKASKHALLFFHPLLTRDFRYCFETQHAEFIRLYGRSPTHFDGHQHLHLATNMLVGRYLPAGAKVRRSFSFAAGEKGRVNRSYRKLVDHLLARRYIITDYFFSIAQHLAPERLARVVQISMDANVELMTHPALRNEFDFLLSPFFGEAIAQTRLGNYSALHQSA